MELITGDLSPLNNTICSICAHFRYDCLNGPPDIVDDLHMCARDEFIDGAGGEFGNIIGNAGPIWGRTDSVTQKLTALAGAIQFDITDIPYLIACGIWESTVLHKMGHIIGVDTLWKLNELVNDDLEYLGQRAIGIWANDWGCDGTPPVEIDFGPGTWVESLKHLYFIQMYTLAHF